MKPLSSTITNAPVLDQAVLDSIGSGWGELANLIRREIARDSRRRPLRIGIDGYYATNWRQVERLNETLQAQDGYSVESIDVRDCQISNAAIAALVQRHLPEAEPVFGRVLRSNLEIFYDPSAVRRLSDRLRKNQTPATPSDLQVVYGPGALQPRLRGRFDLTFYIDCTRQEALRRNDEWGDHAGQTQSVSPRRIYYVDFPVSDRSRRNILKTVDFYVAGTNSETPCFMPRRTLQTLVSALTRMPLRIKPMYEAGVWGGQWLKQNRRLPSSMINCAYGFEIIAPEQSLLAIVGTHELEFPFNTLMETAGPKMVGKRAYRQFGTEFPVRIAYDDTWGGDNLSVQVHPTSRYMRTEFNERMHQAEMYYVFDTSPGGIVHLGLKNGTTREALRSAAEKSEKTRTPFNHLEFVNTVPARKGEILLIPPGTVHGAGANELILEISSTPYRYTFKIYDYCRPNLDGTFRPIHLDHAFGVIKFFRNEKWVRDNLIPTPHLLSEGSEVGSNWREYAIADRREFHHIVNRIEFDRVYQSDTAGKFHMLNLVEGQVVSITPTNGQPSRRLAYSETVLIPGATGGYTITNEERDHARW